MYEEPIIPLELRTKPKHKLVPHKVFAYTIEIPLLEPMNKRRSRRRTPVSGGGRSE